ncbi:MAG: hypothetical protein WC309_00255 [Candidatus Paceibacterota bacterium]|jgi:hypothetical protein|nr:hypothetical protein [Candidatus Paceibacterota bacterium]
MITQQLIDFIKDQLKQGKSEEDIKQTLLLQGWKEEDLNQGFFTVKNPGMDIPSPPPIVNSSATDSNSLKRLSGIKELFFNSWAIFKNNFWRFWLISIVYVLIIAAIEIGLFFIFKPLFSVMSSWLSLFLFFIMGLISTLIIAPYSVSLILIAENNDSPKSLKDIIKISFKKLFSFWWLNFLVSIIKMPALLLGMVFFFFGIPRLAGQISLDTLLRIDAVILLIPSAIISIYLCLSNFILVLNKETAFNSLLKSKEYIKRYWWPVLGRLLLITSLIFVITWVILYYFSFINQELAIAILGILNIMIISPVWICYNYSIYKNIREIKTPSPSSKKTKFLFIALGILGLLMTGAIIYFIDYILRMIDLVGLALGDIPL